MKCDHEHVSNGLGLEHTSGRVMCPWCIGNDADDPDDVHFAMLNIPAAPWNDLRLEAVWRRHVFINM